MQHALYSEHSVEPDEVSQLQWTHGYVGAQLHRGVYILDGSHAFVEGLHSLVDVGYQDTVGDEPRYILGRGTGLLHTLGKG